MSEIHINPFDLLNKSQKIALKVANEAFSTLVSVGSSAGKAATNPDEALRQISLLVGAVGDLASATAQPLQNFIIAQRELADTMASLAAAQSQLADLVQTIAEKHASMVESLEGLSAPVFGLIIKEPKQHED